MQSAPWLNELLLSVERRYLDRLDFAVEELRRLGWICQCSKGFDNGSVTHVTITMTRVVEVEQ